MQMRTLYFILCSFFLTNLTIAQRAGAIVSASNSGKQLFTVGDIFIQGNTGVLGSLNYISNLKVDVQDLDYEDNFILFPNPTTNYFEIKNRGNEEIKSLNLVNINGSKINLQNNDVTQLAPGVYFIQINEKKVIKLVKN
jgi:hypothetical protein